MEEESKLLSEEEVTKEISASNTETQGLSPASILRNELNEKENRNHMGSQSSIRKEMHLYQSFSIPAKNVSVFQW